jgi:anti-sigma factor RsiW
MLPDAGPYVLGALEEPEAEVYREHLAGCAACRREVAELQPVVDMLPVSAPIVPAPGHLRDRIMGVVHSEAELLNAAGNEADRPARRARSRPRWRVGVLGGLAGAAALAAGVLIGAVAIDNGGSTHVTRAVVAAGTGTSAVLRQSGGRAELDVSHMAQAPGGRVYQVWLQRPHGAPEPTDALFVVDRSGNAAVDVPGNLHGVQRVMVTNEPVGGSRVPTTQPVINVPLAS